MSARTGSKTVNFLFPPSEQVRLKKLFPWSLSTALKHYAISWLIWAAVTAFWGALLWGTLDALGKGLLPQFLEGWLNTLIIDRQGNSKDTLVISVMLLAFVTSFAAQLWYLARKLRSSGSSLSAQLSLWPKWQLSTMSSTALLVALAMAVWFGYKAVEATLLLVMPAPEQHTADLVARLQSTSLILFAVMAAVCAPIFEELVFRGVVLNALRQSLSTKVYSSCISDAMAVLFSSLLFAAAHFQFHPTTFLLLTLMGVTMAEAYRRSGTLLLPILIHAINNSVAVWFLSR
ncbi:MAG: CPBP family intramembrane metalloprotease [Candidatus Obscuribacterales bacterium]|nr:CPBP family intramembrane metalloprotease [Candidatus Obscuribacterales bacterium]